MKRGFFFITKNLTQMTIDPRTRIRSSGIVDLNLLKVPITIVGAGAVGSWTTLCLAKLGCTNMSVFDFDSVSIENVGCQLYPEYMVGNPKPRCLDLIVSRFTGISIKDRNVKWEAGDEKLLSEEAIVIMAVDSLEERRIIWEALKLHKFAYLIDARMGGEFMRIFSVDMQIEEAKARYEKTLQGEAHEVRCSERSVVYNTMIIAGLITNQVKRMVKNEKFKVSIAFDIPSLGLY